MEKLSQTAENVKALASKLSAIIHLADALEGIDNIDNATAEAQYRRDKACDEERTAQELLARRLKEVKDAEISLSKLKSESLTVSFESIELSKKKSESIIEEAKKKSFDIIESANFNKNSIQSEIEDLKIVLAQLEENILNKNSELQGIQTKIDAAREHIQNFLGK